MLKFGLSTALFLAASAAAAQPAQTPPPANAAPTPPVAPPPGFMQAAQAMGTCVEAAIDQTPATVTPEATAAQVIAGCGTQKTALETQFEAWVSSPSFPAEGRDMARQQFRSQLTQAEGQLADEIRRRRAAAATPAPAPTPSN